MIDKIPHKKKPLFIKKVDLTKFNKYRKNPAAMLISNYDLGYKGLFGICWGWYKFKFDMYELNFGMRHMWYWTLKMKLKMKIRKFRKKGESEIEFG